MPPGVFLGPSRPPATPASASPGAATVHGMHC
jgi:hypothetical protein